MAASRVTTSPSWCSTGVASRPVHIGCSGWAYPHWRERLYPKGRPRRRWLARYGGVFRTVGVNTPFSRLPSEKAVGPWVPEPPAPFVFAVKASRYLTHVKRLKETPKYVTRFYEPLAPLVDSGKLG